MPVSGPAREIAITYNSFAVGGSSGIDVHGFTAQEVTKDRFSITFDVVITAASAGAFATACNAIELAFSTPYKDLSIAWGGSSHVNVTQSGNTALDAVPSIQNLGAPPDSARSRGYRVRIEYGLPATWATIVGLRDSSVVVAYGPSGRAVVTLNGEFTAVTSNDAKAQYDAQIATFVSNTKSWLSITTWELVGVPELTVSINRKTMTFSRVYEELIFSQGGASNDDTGIIRQELVLTRARKGSEYVRDTSRSGAAPGQTSDLGDSFDDAKPLMDVAATYSAWIDKAVTTDLKSKWESIESWVVSQIKSAAGAQSFGLMSISPSFYPDDNRITATVTGVVQDPDGGSLVQNTFEQTIRDENGWEFVPLWTGDPLDFLAFQGGLGRFRLTTRRWRELAGSSESNSGGEIGWNPGKAAPAGQAGVAMIGTPGIDSGTGRAAAGSAKGERRWIELSHDGTPSEPNRRTVGVGRVPFVVLMTEKWYSTLERYAQVFA